MLYVLFIFFIGLSTPHYSAYIDTRDMAQESARVQRLLGQLDILKITPSKQYTGPNGTQIAMLTMMTTGLALSASSSYRYSYQYNHYYHRPSRYYGRRHNPAATTVGATLAAIGLVGLIGATVADETRQQAELLQQNQYKKIETEVNTIISNLVATDIDFIRENKDLETELTESVDYAILEISRITSNDIQTIKQQEQKIYDDFTKNTNNLTKNIEDLEKNTAEAISYNISQMSRTTTKELKKLNKTLNKQLKNKQKEYKKTLKQETKTFKKNLPNIQENN
ncbi:MAG: hypothetical protein ACRC0X_09595, partial [Brevinema sp.]